MNLLINFLNKFNRALGNLIKGFKIPYPKTLFQKVNGYFSDGYERFLQNIHRFISEEQYAQSLFEKFINRIFNFATISIFILITVLGFLIYKLDQNAFFARKFSLQELESALTLRKPAFTEFDEKEFFVPNIFIPIIIKDRPDISRIYLDIKLRASNRYIKLYFSEQNGVNINKLEDRFLLHLKPIIPLFPLSEEGKDILKKKIKFEANEVLKELKIQGEIEEVIIQDILAA